ncbi:Acetyl esterase/lipase, partial [Lentzea xinjiangensis]
MTSTVETNVTTRVPYDPELGAALSASPLPTVITAEMIGELRSAVFGPPIEELLATRDLDRTDHVIEGPNGEVVLSVLRPRGVRGAVPGIYFTHGGGMVIGDRFTGIDDALDWADRLGAVLVTVEYRLAPEHPDPAPVQDAYAGLVWTAQHAGELGIDLDRLMVAGTSAGAGIAAGLALMARDLGGPRLVAQLLRSPMLDDRDVTVSSAQYSQTGSWSRESNNTGWDALLGDRRKSDAVSVYAAPARAGDLSGLPPAFVDVGSAEVFRDEAVAYASRLWAAGVQAELHVWPGGFHIFDGAVP